MNTIIRREGLPRFPDLAELFEVPFFSTRSAANLRIETSVGEDRYMVRAEVPGVDPDKDITVTVAHGALTIQAERTETSESPQHSEFRYGSFSRTLPLPQDADEDEVTATYDKGILQVDIGLSKERAMGRTVPISRRAQD